MSRHYQFSLLAVLIAVVSAGCRTELADITPEVQPSGFIGLQLRTTQDLAVLRSRPRHMLFLATPDYASSGQDNWDKQVGVLEAGTELQINQAVRVTEPCWVLPIPGYWTWNCILAQIENGPYAGREVAIAGDGIWPGLVVLGSSLLRPVDQASMISLLYSRHPYFRLPVPDKYDFYDSDSNQFATVTLVLSGQHLFGKEEEDGMWFGSLAKSYVRPKSEYILASDKLNIPDLHRLIRYWPKRVSSGTFRGFEIDLNPGDPNDQIILFMPLSETNGPVRGVWIHESDAGEVESGAFAGPIP